MRKTPSAARKDEAAEVRARIQIFKINLHRRKPTNES
jgi:hypothetical protein